MSTSESLNLASLKMVQDELVATIEQAALHLEQFVQNRSNAEPLQDCIECIKQIRGTLNLIQMKGVDLLADELLQQVNDLSHDDVLPSDQRLELLSTSFFILPRYLEYCAQSGRAMPMLLLPHINELRYARKAALLPESYYFAYNPLRLNRPNVVAAPPLPEDYASLVRRLRHMYQTGLLNVLKQVQPRASLGMMIRALERLETSTRGTALGNFWWLASSCIGAMGEMSMRLGRSRRLLFSAIDREIKRFQFEGEGVLEREVDPQLQRELLYILALSHSQREQSTAVLIAYGVPPLGFSETELQREHEFLKGPSANTVSSMVTVLRDELHSTKNILERATQGGIEMLKDSPELLNNLKKIADILKVIGLVAPSNGLHQEIEKITRWQTQGVSFDESDLLQVADTLLYVESTVAGLGNASLSDEKLAQINALSRSDAISNNQLAEAEKIVIDEAEAGLVLVKRALTSFAESNYDKGHISNIVSTLDSVRGGMFVLNLPRAAKVLATCMEFVSEELLQGEQHPAVQHLLETFADAIISLEYYLDSLKLDKNADTGVLQIAEESLQALGYEV